MKNSLSNLYSSITVNEENEESKIKNYIKIENNEENNSKKINQLTNEINQSLNGQKIHSENFSSNENINININKKKEKEKEQNILDSQIQSNSEEIFKSTSKEKQPIKTISILPRNSNTKTKSYSSPIKNNTSFKVKNILLNKMKKSTQNKNSSNKNSSNNISTQIEEKNIFNFSNYDLLDGEIMTESELKQFNLNQVTLRFIDILYKDDFKFKGKEEIKLYDEKIFKIANMIIYMNNLNQIKVMECMRKAANSFIKKKFFEKLVKNVDEMNKLKKFGISDYMNSSDISKYVENGYSGRMSNSKYYK